MKEGIVYRNRSCSGNRFSLADNSEEQGIQKYFRKHILKINPSYTTKSIVHAWRVHSNSISMQGKSPFPKAVFTHMVSICKDISYSALLLLDAQ